MLYTIYRYLPQASVSVNQRLGLESSDLLEMMTIVHSHILLYSRYKNIPGARHNLFGWCESRKHKVLTSTTGLMNFRGETAHSWFKWWHVISHSAFRTHWVYWDLISCCQQVSTMNNLLQQCLCWKRLIHTGQVFTLKYSVMCKLSASQIVRDSLVSNLRYTLSRDF